MKTFKTPKGTELPLMDIKGKDYLQVQHRVMWFRESHPDWGIETEIVASGPGHTLFKATIKDEKGRILATAHKYEDKQGFADHNEKSETSAIGRALALVGYGTQFAVEMEEGERIVDSPVAPRGFEYSAAPVGNPADYVVPFGKKYKGMKLSEIGSWELESYVNFLRESSAKEGKEPGAQAKELISMVAAYLDGEDKSL